MHPEAVEVCDGRDNRCTGAPPDEDADADADGQSICDGDCDDADPARFAGNTETCDGLDDDCDGHVPLDEVDADQDGTSACAGDCDDLDPDDVCGAEPDDPGGCGGGHSAAPLGLLPLLLIPGRRRRVDGHARAR